MKILIIQQKMIGDVLATSILFEVIKHRLPNAKLHYVINSHTFPVVENNPFIDKFHYFTSEHEKSKLELYKFAKTLSKEKFDVVIDVYSKFSSNLITLISKANIKVSKHKWYTSWIYSHTFKEAKIPKTNAGLAIENRLQLLKPLGINSDEIVKPKIYLTDSEKTKARLFIESHNITLSHPIYMIGVLGSGSNKTYPFKYMSDIIDNIVEAKPESQILFNYIPNQEEEAKTIFELCSTETKKHIFFNVFGSSLRDFLALTFYCDALIGNEGGATNMAKAINIPTFTIFSPWIKKEAWNMFDDDKQNVSVHLKDYKPELFTEKSTKELKKNWKLLYERFAPNLIKSSLQKFLKHI